MTTDPEEQAKWYSKRRASVGANLTPVAKLVRRWNSLHSQRFESFHLEVMVASMFKSLGSNHQDALKCFCEWAPNRITVVDPAGHSGNLDDYLTKANGTAIKSRFTEAFERTKKALTAEAAGDHTEAKRLWRIELGDGFPS
jgi:hypothetical protein